jgi:hypothetical protein
MLGFSKLFFRSLGKKFTVGEWENTFDYHSWRLLEDTFPDVQLPKSGPALMLHQVYISPC